MGMFDDIFSSSRGPGVIGTLLALVILVGFGSLYMFVFDEGLQGGEKSIQSIIRDQEAQIGNLNAGIKANEASIVQSKEREKLTSDVVSLERQLKLREPRLTELAEQMQATQKLIDSTAAEWEKYKAQYRSAERARAIGEKFPELITKSGKTYKNITITKFDDRRMTIMSETGSTGIEWTELPDTFVDRFQFTKELASAKVAAETVITEGMATAAKISTLKESLAYKKTQLQTIDSTFQQASADIAQANNRINAHQNNITQLRGQIAAEVNKKGVRKIPFYEGEIRELTKKIETENNKIKNHASVEQTYQAERQKLLDESTKIESDIRQLEQSK